MEDSTDTISRSSETLSYCLFGFSTRPKVPHHGHISCSVTARCGNTSQRFLGSQFSLHSLLSL